MMNLPQLYAKAGGFRNYCGREVSQDVNQVGQMLFMTTAEIARSSLGWRKALQVNRRVCWKCRWLLPTSLPPYACIVNTLSASGQRDYATERFRLVCMNSVHRRVDNKHFFPHGNISELHTLCLKTKFTAITEFIIFNIFYFKCIII